VFLKKKKKKKKKRFDFISTLTPFDTTFLKK